MDVRFDAPTHQLADTFGEYRRWEFPNGYGASVIRSLSTYGGDRGQWELAVLHHGEITSATAVTDGILGYLTEDQVVTVLERIAALPLTTKEQP